MEAERHDPPARRAASEEPPVRASAAFAREDSPRPAPAAVPARSEPVRAESDHAGPRVPVTSAPSNACDWASVQAAAAESRRQVKMVVEEATMLEFKDGCVSLNVAQDLMTAAAATQEEIRQLVGRTWGRPVRIEFAQPVALQAPAQATLAPSAQGASEGEVKEVQAQGPNLTVANATDNPLIAKAVELFGAKVLGVYPRQK